ncbi:hypothetical protein FTT16_08440 [Campylobacter jejuni]|nr:hypothetical protein [Campylobacter jejuni]
MTNILLKLLNFLNLEENKTSNTNNEHIIPLNEKGFTSKEEIKKRSSLYSKNKNKKIIIEKEEIVNKNNKLFRVKTQKIINSNDYETDEIVKTEQYQITR